MKSNAKKIIIAIVAISLIALTCGIVVAVEYTDEFRKEMKQLDDNFRTSHGMLWSLRHETLREYTKVEKDGSAIHISWLNKKAGRVRLVITDKGFDSMQIGSYVVICEKFKEKKFFGAHSGWLTGRQGPYLAMIDGVCRVNRIGENGSFQLPRTYQEYWISMVCNMAKRRLKKIDMWPERFSKLYFF